MNKFLITVIFIFFPYTAFCQLPNNNMQLLSNLNQHQAAGLYSAIWGYTAGGREYAILACFNGTAFIDITDSLNIREVDFLPGAGTTAREMKTYSHYAYITTDISPESVGLQIVDLQYLPDSVSFVKNWNYQGLKTIHTISQSGPYLYLNGGDMTINGGTTIVDVTDPVNPIRRGSWTNKYVHDGRVRNDTMFACNIYAADGGTITVIDVRNKDNPQTITSWANAPNPGPHNLDFTADRKYCFVTDEINGNPRILKIWNIQNLSNVVQAATWQPSGIFTSIIHNIEIYNNIAVIAHYTAGVRVLNISNPVQPVEIAWYDTYPANNDFTFNGCWGVYMFPSGKIAASDRQTGLWVNRLTSFPTGIEGNTITAKDYSLSQNYPNPFNPATKIAFTLPKNSVVSLKVFDLSGKEVAELLNDRRDGGKYEVTFDAGRLGLSSGIYFYKLSAEGFTETRKMMLIK